MYKNRNFWTPDLKLQVWLGALAREAEALLKSKPLDHPEWVILAVDHWERQARNECPGCIVPMLDALIATDARRNRTVQWAKSALSWLESQGAELSSDVVKTLNGNREYGPFRTEEVTRVGAAFISLLSGDEHPDIERSLRPEPIE